MSFTLRPYQDAALDSVKTAHQACNSVLVEMATGLGKTVIFSRYASSWEHGRTIVICPIITLIGQAAKKLCKETGIMPSVEQAGEWSNEHEWARSPYIVASKQTLCSKWHGGKKRYERFEDVGLVIVDEAHYVATEQYSELIKWYTDRGAKVLGLTATAKRHDKRAMGQVFDECCYRYGIVDAIDDGWLVSPLVVCKQLQHLDLSDVETTNTFLGKDFNQKQLNEKLEDTQVIYEIAEAVNQETRDDKTAIFCASVNEAQAVSELLSDQYGIKSGWICSDTKRCTEQRKTETLASFTSDDPGGITHLCNVGMITTGFDYPALKNIVMARPTKSLPLYTQIIGRATRPLDGVVDFEGSTPESRKQRIAESAKPHFRVIDLVDASLKHKLVTTVDVLGGEWTLAMREQVFRESLNKGREVDLTEEMLAIIRSKELEEERRLRAARAAKQAQATFSNVSVDPFGNQHGTVRDRQQRNMASEKQCKYLWVLGFKDVNNYSLTKSQAGRAIQQLKDMKMSVSEVKRLNGLRPTDSIPIHATQSKDTHQSANHPEDNDIFSLFR